MTTGSSNNPSTFEKAVEKRKYSIGLIASLAAIVGIASNSLSMCKTTKDIKKSNEEASEKLINASKEESQKLVAALNQAFDRQLSQSNNDIEVVNLVTQYFQKLPGTARKKTSDKPVRVESTDAAKIWVSNPVDLHAAYKADSFELFEINEPAIASARAALEILLRKSENRESTVETPEQHETKNRIKNANRDLIIAPQLQAAAGSFDPTVRIAALKLSSFLASPPSNVVPVSKDENFTNIERLKTSFTSKMLGMASYGSEDLKLSEFDFSSTVFTGATFENSVDFTGSIFVNCSLSGVTFMQKSTWVNANKELADVRTNFSGSRFVQTADFTDAFFGGVTFSTAEAPTTWGGDVNFIRTKLQGSNFSNGNFFGSARFLNSVVDGTIFVNTNFIDVSFEGIVGNEPLAGGVEMNFSGSNLKSALFRSCDISNSKFNDATFDNVVFAGGDRRAIMHNCDLGGVKHGQEGVSTVKFINVDLSFSKFVGSNFRSGVEFSNCLLDGIDFSSTTLAGGKFSNCNAKEVRLPAVAAGAQVYSIEGGGFTNGSWLVDVPFDGFSKNVSIDNSFIAHNLAKRINEEGVDYVGGKDSNKKFCLTVEPQVEPKRTLFKEEYSAVLAIEKDANGNSILKGVLEFRSGNSVTYMESSEAVLGVLKQRGGDFGLAETPPSTKEEWQKILAEAKGNRPAIQWP